jgi:hypothetical protein
VFDQFLSILRDDLPELIAQDIRYMQKMFPNPQQEDLDGA